MLLLVVLNVSQQVKKAYIIIKKSFFANSFKQTSFSSWLGYYTLHMTHLRIIDGHTYNKISHVALRDVISLQLQVLPFRSHPHSSLHGYYAQRRLYVQSTQQQASKRSISEETVNVHDLLYNIKFLNYELAFICMTCDSFNILTLLLRMPYCATFL